MHQIQSEFVKDEAQRVTLYPIAGIAEAWEDDSYVGPVAGCDLYDSDYHSTSQSSPTTSANTCLFY